MGAVRIYKKDIGDPYLWHARVGGCTNEDAMNCGSNHVDGEFCDDFLEYETLIATLNSDTFPYDLGAYLKK